jgi:pSer/pThr/pTyr-binding forkhead associated (FHA) protein
MASILVISAGGKGDYYSLGQRTTVIGRDEALPIQILDKQVSRKHMHICFDENDGRYYVFDMKSKHGVFINGKKIGGEFYMSISCRGFTSDPLPIPNSTGDILRVIPTR